MMDEITATFHDRVWLYILRLLINWLVTLHTMVGSLSMFL